MAKVVDITNKLNFEENPKLVINGRQYEVNADAETALRVMNAVESGDDTKVIGAMSLLFKPKDLEAITRIKKERKEAFGKCINYDYAGCNEPYNGRRRVGEQ